MKFLTGLSAKAWGVIALVVLALIAWGVWEHRAKEVVELKSEVKTQATTIAVQKDTITTDQKLDKIDEKTQVDTQQAVKAVVTKHESIQAKVAAKAEAIDEKYDGEPVTIQTVEQKQDELSGARIDSLWEAYCAATPSAFVCQPQGEPHA